MIAMTYPKIETLYNRDSKFKVIPGDYRCPEFQIVRDWIITEKIDGTNVRVALHADGTVEFNGRSDKADLPKRLVEYLTETFVKSDRMQRAFPSAFADRYPEVILFGEGYGAGIQNGGSYNQKVNFRLFDCVIAGDVLGGWWWMQPQQLMDIALKLGIATCPVLGTLYEFPVTKMSLEYIIGSSIVALEESGNQVVPEGIVARPSYTLLDRSGNRVMWKLKLRDF